jgi:signal peptidase I
MKTYLKGSFWKRLMAFIVDEVILLVGLFILFFILEMIGVKTEGFEKIIFWVISIAYNVIFLQKWGVTIGKKLLKLRVVNTEYQPVNTGQVLIRESVGKLYSTLLFNLGYLHVLKHPQRQAWHDKMAKTYVVTVDNKGQFIPVTDETVSKRDKFTYWTLFIVAIIPLLLAILVIFYLFFASPNQIKGVAMAPSYIDGQYYLTDKWSYRFSEPQRGDVVVYKAPNNQDIDYFKRIVGLPGEEIQIREGKFYINSQILDEPYLTPGTVTYEHTYLREGQKLLIPQGQYFVMGDNRPHSSDSRAHGPIPKEDIVGKMTVCYWNCNPSK